ncbi:DUF5330 domain-containing protein [Roseibium sediminis]|uniref:DUF5330 domain-containing protein n=1 Tax=Roseibium sediminis TaxID=1775174 RepID=UPI00123D48EC|nr:DUF5330 domain-containing protein [Roseibium sediminis]
MFFLLRTAFWITLVLVLIPLGSDKEESAQLSIDPVATFFAAQAAVSDFGGFCDRNPDACKTGGEALTAIGAQARDGARIVYEFLDEKVATPDGQGGFDQSGASVVSIEPQSPLTTGSTNRVGVSDLAQISGPASLAAGHSIDAPAQGPVIGAIPRPNPRLGHRT